MTDSAKKESTFANPITSNTEQLRVCNLSVSFPKADGTRKNVVSDVSFSVAAGEIVGIAGESGSGKSMSALAVMDLLPAQAQRSATGIFWEETDLTGGTKKEREMRRRMLSGSEMAMIFQEPLTCLNPVQNIEKQMEEPLRLHAKHGKNVRKYLILQALRDAGLNNPNELLKQYPHQLSGGMRQRVMIAMAMINRPKLLIADEPTTALDAVTELEIVRLIRELSQKYHTSVLFISHNLNLQKTLCDRILIMKDGKVVEQGSAKEIFEHPQEEYTKNLMDAVVRGPKPEEKRYVISESSEDFMQVTDLSVVFKKKRNGFRAPLFVSAVDHVSFEVKRGEIFGIVGESGCGKSTLLKTISGLNKNYSGTFRIGKTETGTRMVFQDPYTSLNPAKKVGWILEEPLRLQTGLTKEERRERVLKMLTETELDEEIAERYVSELSGGQRQRVAIAVALIVQPELVLLDEPVSALDVTVQAQILDLLLRLQKEYNLTYLFVSHDMAVVRKICDRVMVMKNGRILECGPAEEIFLYPKEGYTKKLVEAGITDADDFVDK